MIDEWWQEPGIGDQSLEDGHHEFWDDVLVNAIDRDFAGKKILDFGCNQGGFLRRVYQAMKFREAVGVDIAQKSVQQANARKGDIPVTYLALDNLESLDRDFDFAISTAVIYLIQEIAEHAKQVFERLKPGGIYYATHPDYLSDPQFKFVQDAINDFAAIKCATNDIDSIIAGFESAGFSVYVKRMVPTGYIPVPMSAKSRWYGSASAEVDYWYKHRYSFKCFKPNN